MRNRHIHSTMLWSGVLVPAIYFGAQLVRGPFVEGYSFRRNAASDLGAVGVPGASWFNAMAIASGLAAIVASFGWWYSLAHWAVGWIRRSLLCVALVSIGVASIAAGAFPLPDERHGGGPLGAGLFALPLLLVLATVRSQVTTWIRWYAVANLLLFVLAALLFSGATGVDPTVNQGVLQRLLALAVFPPIAVVSAAALRVRYCRVRTVNVDGSRLIEEHGILLQSARGPVPNIPELVVGGTIRGSWWSHPQHDEIFAVLNEAMIPGAVIRMRLVGGKVTLVHRRLWPAIVKLAHNFDPEHLAVIEEEHSVTGAHRKTIRPFPEWVSDDVLAEASTLSVAEAAAQLPECLRTV